MHDRRIDGQAHTFGNQGALFKDAMVWWDHETESLWAQPTGVALSGEYEGVRLEGIPVSIQPWGEWLAAHPNTVMLVEEDGRLPRPGMDPFRTRPRFVMGITIGGESRAYYVERLAKQAIFNDELAGEPLLVFAPPSALFANIYSRSVNGVTLTFVGDGGTLSDTGTGSTWDAATGIATTGPLAGTRLR